MLTIILEHGVKPFFDYRLAELGHSQNLMTFIRQVDFERHPERQSEVIAVKKRLRLLTDSSPFVNTRRRRTKNQSGYYHLRNQA